jgi:hypothetical protein
VVTTRGCAHRARILDSAVVAPGSALGKPRLVAIPVRHHGEWWIATNSNVSQPAGREIAERLQPHRRATSWSWRSSARCGAAATGGGANRADNSPKAGRNLVQSRHVLDSRSHVLSVTAQRGGCACRGVRLRRDAQRVGHGRVRARRGGRAEARRPDGCRAQAGSSTYGRIVGRLDMPNVGDELHHFGWNACSSALCPWAPHPHVERRYLLIPGSDAGS